MALSLPVDDFAGAPGEAHLAPVIERLVTDPGRLIGLGVDMGDVRDMEACLLLDDAAGFARPRRRVALDHIDALHQDTLPIPLDAQDLAALALVAAGADHHLVALLDLEFGCHLEHLRRQRNDFHEVPDTQFAGHRPENAGADRLALLVDEDGRVAVEADRAPVGAADLLGGTHDHRLMHLALLDAPARDRFLDRDHDHIAHRRRLALGAAQHLDALDAPRPGIVGDIEVGLHLDHDDLPLGPSSHRFLCLVIRAEHDPALALRDRTAFLETHGVAGLEAVILVMHGVFLRFPDDFLVGGVHDAPLDPDDYRLVASVAHHHALKDTFRHVLSLSSRRLFL